MFVQAQFVCVWYSEARAGFFGASFAQALRKLRASERCVAMALVGRGRPAAGAIVRCQEEGKWRRFCHPNESIKDFPTLVVQ